MKFRRRIFWIFTAYALMLTIIAGGIYSVIRIRQHKEKAAVELEKCVTIVRQQFEQQVREMDGVTNSILSDSEVLTALRVLSGIVPSYEESDKKSARNIMKVRLFSDYLLSNFYRVVFCNQEGEVISTGILDKSSAQWYELHNISWIDEASERTKGFLLTGSHKDDWYSKSDVQVISVVRKLQGNKLGYLEVQKRTDDFAGLFQLESNRYTLYIHRPDGTVLYTGSSVGQSRMPLWYNRIGAKDGVGKIPRDAGGGTFISRYCEDANAVVTIVDNTNWMEEGIKEMIPSAFLLILAIAGISCIYILLASHYVSRPIQVLGDYMKRTDLDSMGEELQKKLPNDEIEMLYQEYRKVMQRLNKSMKKEKQLSLLQLQAQFDLLQAQVNPHFLYNVLNVISSRGMEDDDETICDMCDDLAWMLRYATDTKERYGAVSGEVQYLERYFHLLKYRYEDKLQYEIAIPDELMKQILPKIILQQIVENSIAHGYENVSKVMHIYVKGMIRQECWYVEIIDNGSGISSEIRDRILKQCSRIRRQLTSNREHVEFTLGGMGLANLYARLYLILQDKMIFEIETGHQGTIVRIGETRQGERDVPDFSSR